MQRPLVARFLICLLATLLLPTSPLRGQEIAPALVDDVVVTRNDDGWWLDADIDFELNPQLREAAERGLTLYFAADLTVTEPRWWWFDRNVISVERLWSISYNALIRQWGVSGGGLALPVASLDEALALVRHIRGWHIAPPDTFEPGETYQGQLRLRLDISQLSRPLQVNALNSSAWAASTPWKRFTITVDPEGP